MNERVNILGTEYVIRHVNTDACTLLGESSGICDSSTKTIWIKDNGEPTPETKQNLEYVEKKVLRHEIIHAFMYESGLAENSNDIDQWAEDEELIDWIAIQSPKMLKAFEEAGAL
ncbi:MAG TPA: hypothetical protein PLM48_08120 [Clostridia bacterium]|nr:hypothetical protein [Clostridia bacterium]